MTKLAYLGTPELSVGPLMALVDAGHDVTQVISRPDAKRGRGGALVESPVKAAAQTLGIEVTDTLESLRLDDIDLAVVVVYGAIIPTALLARVPMVNIHFSLLPRWRGAAPVERAILAGDRVTGVTIMAIEPSLDSGPIYSVASTSVDDKTLTELQAELSSMGAELLVELVNRWCDDRPVPSEQLGEITYAKKIDPRELELDLHASAIHGARTVRLGRAFTFLGERRLRVLEARVVDPIGQAPGTLVGTTVAFAEGALELLVVQPEGKRAIDARAWRNGIRTDGAIVLGGTQSLTGSRPRLES